MTEIFTKLRNGQEVDMRSPEYLPVIEELHRANQALFELNQAARHALKGSKQHGKSSLMGMLLRVSAM